MCAYICIYNGSIPAIELKLSCLLDMRNCATREHESQKEKRRTPSPEGVLSSQVCDVRY
jgi:hypothetical protein